ncbi:hypothetical protein M407DRAFT_217124 [Tulasnella calospora MUT 4182]|uniref:Homeobox domain-containing protein n=1 Tax=Tulasnella calospora MUT 4182 TaxID=1051891 RepID=A0A0C3LD69_9AGAM|nr:hypothetical protein M407DRAFT_217124 [Tulasnella calospora MUT 4182]
MSAEQASSSSSSSLSVSRLLSTIRGAKSRLQNERPRTTPNSVHPPPPAISHNLPAPEDITSRLASDLGLEFRVARKVSQAYVDKAVELQFLSQKRMGSTHKKIIRTARSSKAVADVNQLQNMLRDSQKRFYKRDIRSLLKQTTELAKACYPNTRATELEDTEDEDATSPTMKARGNSADGSDDEGADGESGGGPADAEDEKALQDMSVLSSCILTGMYEKGHTFPRRHEKIKLAEATGLTYRQIGIWYSNRRERNRPGRKGGLAPSSSFTDSVSAATRESTVEISMSGRETTEATSPIVQPHFGFNQLNFTNENRFAPSLTGAQELQQDLDDDMAATEVEDELDSPAGQDGSLDGSRITSVSTSASNLESMFVPAGDSQSSVDSYSDPWASVFASSFVDLPAESSANAPTFDFSLPTETPAEPSCSTATMSIDFHDLSFLQQPATTMNAQSADFLAGFMAGQAASSSAQFLTHTIAGPSQTVWQPTTRPSVGDYQTSPPTQPPSNYPTPSTYLPYAPRNQDAADVRPSKRPRVGGDTASPGRLSPARSAGPSRSRDAGLQQRRMAIAGQSTGSSRNQSGSVPRGSAPIAIAPRPAPPSQNLASRPNNPNRGIKRAASSQNLAQTSSATVNPMLLNNNTLRNIKPMPQQSARRLQPSHPGLVLPLAQPAMAMQ